MNEPVLMFTVSGHPHAQPRPRFVRGHAVGIPKGSKAEPWMRAVTSAVRRLALVQWGAEHGKLAPDGLPWWVRFEAVEIEMRFAFGLPAVKGKRKRHDRHPGDPHTVVPDSDNLAKLIMDVMQREGLVEDDRRVAKLIVTKEWANAGGVTVVVRQRRFVTKGIPKNGLTADLVIMDDVEATPESADDGIGSGDHGLGADRPPDWIGKAIAKRSENTKRLLGALLKGGSNGR